MISKDGWRTGEYDQTRDGNFVCEAWPEDGGPIIIAVFDKDTKEWILTNYHGAPFTREDDSATIRDIAGQLMEQSGWK